VSSVKPYVEEIIGEARAPVWTLFGATLLVLVIACANVANLLLLREEDRRLQFAVRTALGAGRLRLAQLVAVEALLLCALGGAAGVLLARASLGVVIAVAPPELPRLELLRVDWTVVLFGTLTAIVAAAVSSAPSFAALRVGSPVVSGGTRAPPAAFRQSRRTFVVTQVALSMTILAAAGVLTRTLLRLQSAEMGFSADRLAFVELFLPLNKYSDPKARRPLLEELTARVRAIPGVEAAVPVAVRPYAGLSGWDMPRWVADGQSAEEASRNPGLDVQSVYPDHFATMGIPILEGRAIDRFDREGGKRVAVIGENAARQVWPGESAIGKRLKWGGLDSEAPWFTIVGVAATTRYRELAEPRAAVYLAATQFIDGAESLAIRASTTMAAISGPLRSHLRDLDDSVFVIRSSAFSEIVAGPLARPRFVSSLASAFGVCAVLLATVGLYSVMAAFVRQSSREIGVRMALGATSHHVRALVFGEAARLAGVGVVLGVAGALTTERLLRRLLVGAPPLDPAALALAAVAMTLTIVIACYYPLRRALRIDPVALLRMD
jgi:predicted permease